MSRSERNTLKKSTIDENRNQRSTEPRQPGAYGSGGIKLPPANARSKAVGRLGKTGKNTSSKPLRS